MRLTFCLQSLTNLETQIMIGSLDSICNFSDVFTLAFSRLVIFKNPNKASRSNLSKMKIRFQASSALSTYFQHVLQKLPTRTHRSQCSRWPMQNKDQRARCTEATSTSCLAARMFRSLPAPFMKACFLSKANFFVHISLEDGQGKVSIRIVDFREMTGTADIFICPV